jgi:hypothetical protein
MLGRLGDPLGEPASGGARGPGKDAGPGWDIVDFLYEPCASAQARASDYNTHLLWEFCSRAPTRTFGRFGFERGARSPARAPLPGLVSLAQDKELSPHSLILYKRTMEPNTTVIHCTQAELQARAQRVADAKAGEIPDRHPVLVNVSDFSYADLVGISVDQYLTDPLCHARAQILGQKWVFEHLRTDVCSLAVHPRLGAAPSAFGAPMVRSPGNRTWVKPCVTGPEDLRRIEKLDIERTGIEEANAEYARVFRDSAKQFPVAFADGDVFYPLARQGPPFVGATEDPLTLATDLMGADAFFMACFDRPGFVRDLLTLLTDKLVPVIRRNQAATGFGGEFFVSSDYAPMLSVEMYVEFALPCLQRIKEATAGPMRLHHCDVPGHLVDVILADLAPEILNGFKARGDVVLAMRVMAEKVGDRAFLEPYLDGVTLRGQEEHEIYADALGVIDLFSQAGCRFLLGAQSCDGHPADDLTKLNAVMRAAEDHAAGARPSSARTC